MGVGRCRSEGGRGGFGGWRMVVVNSVVVIVLGVWGELGVLGGSFAFGWSTGIAKKLQHACMCCNGKLTALDCEHFWTTSIYLRKLISREC